MATWMQPDDDDFDDDDQEQQNQQQAPKALRKHLSKLEKELIALRKERDDLKATTRKTVIAEALSAKGMNAKLAGLVPADVEATPEAVEKWLADYADLFPAKQEKPASQATSEDGGEGEGEEQEEESGEDAEFAASMTRMSQVTGSAKAPTKEADLVAAVKTAKNREELDKLITAAGGGYGSG